jgi:hypothetical protein
MIPDHFFNTVLELHGVDDELLVTFYLTKAELERFEKGDRYLRLTTPRPGTAARVVAKRGEWSFPHELPELHATKLAPGEAVYLWCEGDQLRASVQAPPAQLEGSLFAA